MGWFISCETIESTSQSIMSWNTFSQHTRFKQRNNGTNLVHGAVGWDKDVVVNACQKLAEPLHTA